VLYFVVFIFDVYVLCFCCFVFLLFCVFVVLCFCCFVFLLFCVFDVSVTCILYVIVFSVCYVVFSVCRFSATATG
jgi:hypothetical protein